MMSYHLPPKEGRNIVTRPSPVKGKKRVFRDFPGIAGDRGTAFRAPG